MGPLRKIILVGLGRGEKLRHRLRTDEWRSVVETADKQRILGLIWKAAESLPESQKPPQEIREKLDAVVQSYSIMHEVHRDQCKELRHVFAQMSFCSCIIKGEAFARYYPEPELRHCGDIDIWVEGDRKQIIEALEDKGYKVTKRLYQECEVEFFKSTKVDVHFYPAKMYNPVLNSRLKEFYDFTGKTCFDQGYTTILFDIVHSVVHAFRHFISGQLTYHQLMDCYYVLLHSGLRERTKAYRVLHDLGLGNFTACLMYALEYLYELGEAKMICAPAPEWKGKKFYREIKGKDDRLNYDGGTRTFNHLKYFWMCPRELFWAPAARIWHYFYRKFHC